MDTEASCIETQFNHLSVTNVFLLDIFKGWYLNVSDNSHEHIFKLYALWNIYKQANFLPPKKIWLNYIKICLVHHECDNWRIHSFLRAHINILIPRRKPPPILVLMATVNHLCLMLFNGAISSVEIIMLIRISWMVISIKMNWLVSIGLVCAAHTAH
jgi:hypothetical protein